VDHPDRLSEQNLSQEYVKLAVSVLEKPNHQSSCGLRNWAVDLLNQNSRPKFAPETIRELKRARLTSLDFSATCLATANQGVVWGSLTAGPAAV